MTYVDPSLARGFARQGLRRLDAAESEQSKLMKGQLARAPARTGYSLKARRRFFNRLAKLTRPVRVSAFQVRPDMRRAMWADADLMTDADGDPSGVMLVLRQITFDKRAAPPDYTEAVVAYVTLHALQRGVQRIGTAEDARNIAMRLVPVSDILLMLVDFAVNSDADRWRFSLPVGSDLAHGDLVCGPEGVAVTIRTLIGETTMAAPKRGLHRRLTGLIEDLRKADSITSDGDLTPEATALIRRFVSEPET